MTATQNQLRAAPFPDEVPGSHTHPSNLPPISAAIVCWNFAGFWGRDKTTREFKCRELEKQLAHCDILFMDEAHIESYDVDAVEAYAYTKGYRVYCGVHKWKPNKPKHPQPTGLTAPPSAETNGNTPIRPNTPSTVRSGIAIWFSKTGVREFQVTKHQIIIPRQAQKLEVTELADPLGEGFDAHQHYGNAYGPTQRKKEHTTITPHISPTRRGIYAGDRNMTKHPADRFNLGSSGDLPTIDRRRFKPLTLCSPVGTTLQCLTTAFTTLSTKSTM